MSLILSLRRKEPAFLNGSEISRDNQGGMCLIVCGPARVIRDTGSSRVIEPANKVVFGMLPGRDVVVNGVRIDRHAENKLHISELKGQPPFRLLTQPALEIARAIESTGDRPAARLVSALVARATRPHDEFLKPADRENFDRAVAAAMNGFVLSHPAQSSQLRNIVASHRYHTGLKLIQSLLPSTQADALQPSRPVT